MDSADFRLAVLTQILILLQDLNTHLLENPNFKPVASQEIWIGDVTKKAFYLISLHSDGKEYFRFLRSVFRIERFWVLGLTKKLIFDLLVNLEGKLLSELRVS